jgi:hypothetical protein
MSYDKFEKPRGNFNLNATTTTADSFGYGLGQSFDYEEDDTSMMVEEDFLI